MTDKPTARPALRPRPHPLDVEPPALPAPPVQAVAAPLPAPKTALNARIDLYIHGAVRHAALDLRRTVAEITEEALGEWLERNGRGVTRP
ncbi:MAG TPA: hypothetical protein VF954_05655 [Acidimicrobiales bacterium]